MSSSQSVINENQPSVIALDVGGTHIRGSIIRAEDPLTLQHLIKIQTPQNAPDFLAALCQVIQDLQAQASNTLQGVGIATAGMVNPHTGTLIGSIGNLPFLKTIPHLAEALTQQTQLPVRVENDANAAAYGEYWYRQIHTPHLNNQSLLMVTLGTGIGGGFVYNGNIYHGSQFCALEVGHLIISRENPSPCNCGKSGCWEAYASGTGLTKQLHHHVQTHPLAKTSCLNTLGKPIQDLTNPDLIQAWQSGDVFASHLMDQWHTDVSIGLESLLEVLNPDALLIGGGLSQFINLDVLHQQIRQRSPQPTPIEKACLGDNAGMVGAAQLVLES